MQSLQLWGKNLGAEVNYFTFLQKNLFINLMNLIYTYNPAPISNIFKINQKKAGNTGQQ